MQKLLPSMKEKRQQRVLVQNLPEDQLPFKAAKHDETFPLEHDGDSEV